MRCRVSGCGKVATVVCMSYAVLMDPVFVLFTPDVRAPALCDDHLAEDLTGRPAHTCRHYGDAVTIYAPVPPRLTPRLLDLLQADAELRDRGRMR